MEDMKRMEGRLEELQKEADAAEGQYSTTLLNINLKHEADLKAGVNKVPYNLDSSPLFFDLDYLPQNIRPFPA